MYTFFFSFNAFHNKNMLLKRIPHPDKRLDKYGPKLMLLAVLFSIITAYVVIFFFSIKSFKFLAKSRELQWFHYPLALLRAQFFFSLHKMYIWVHHTIIWKSHFFQHLDIHYAIVPQVTDFFFLLWISFYYCTKQ